jgi:hypothetical protein
LSGQTTRCYRKDVKEDERFGHSSTSRIYPECGEKIIEVMENYNQIKLQLS